MSRDVGKRSIVDDHFPPMFQGLTLLSVDHEYAKIALQFYEETQDAKFEILEVLFSNRATLVIPGCKGVGPWCHVSFTAKRENSDSPGQHFFGEMVLDHDSEKYKVTYCSVFDPSDPGNVNGCVFCPVTDIFLHPADGCPAGGREKDNFMAQKGTDVSGEQIRRCSKRHRSRRNVSLTGEASDTFNKAESAIKLRYAKIALEFFEKSKDAEFEIVEVLQAINNQVVVPGSKSIEEWCHVCFVAKPRNIDSINFSPKHFFGELLRDTITGKYNATYCEIFKPSDRKVTHNCVICPQLLKHPSKGFRVGRPPYSIAEYE